MRGNFEFDDRFARGVGEFVGFRFRAGCRGDILRSNNRRLPTFVNHVNTFKGNVTIGRVQWNDGLRVGVLGDF